MLKVVAATTAFGLLHSLLASRAVKTRVSRFFGEQQPDTLYRVFFNAQAAVTTGLLVVYIVRHPGREVYKVHGPVRMAMHAGQGVALVMIAAAVREIGLTRMAGLYGLVHGADSGHLLPAVEAQGPVPNSSGELRTGGPFRLCRHPLNFWAVPVIWLWPRMTSGLLAFNVAATVYFVVGSWREERRLMQAYGKEYARYVESGVPFFIPRIRPGNVVTTIRADR